MVDMYIVEGPKIFYRLALSALKLYTSLAQSAGTQLLYDTVAGFF